MAACLPVFPEAGDERGGGRTRKEETRIRR